MAEREKPSPYEIVGTLPDWAIRAHIKDGVIKIDPLPPRWDDPTDGIINQVRVDLRLGHKIRRFKEVEHRIIDIRFISREEMDKLTEEIILSEGQPLVLGSEDFVTATTLERLTLPANIVGYLHGRSTLARLGIQVHATAPQFDPGWDGNPTLEMGTMLSRTTILLYPGDKICAFHFERLAADVETPYMEKRKRRFGGSDGPQVSTL